MKILNLSRRRFITTTLASSATLVLGAAVPVRARQPFAPVESSFTPNLFVGIDAHGLVTITCHRSEMGQGVRTAVAQIIADELDADWSKVRVVQAQGDAKYGDQNTDGSSSIRLFFDSLREAGARAGQMLRQAAADQWKVDVEQCVSADHHVRHAASGRVADYGSLTQAASKLAVPEKVDLKSPLDYRYIGKGMQHVDAGAITLGSAVYGADMRVPDMAVGVLVRPPQLGAQALAVELSDTTKARAGFIGVEVIDPTPGAPLFFPVGGVAVIAADTYTAMQIASEAQIRWSASPNATFDSESLSKALRESVAQPGKRLYDNGDVDAAFNASTDETSVRAIYETPFLSHAPMEPLTALASFDDGKVEIWAPVQDPQTVRRVVAEWLKIDLENVTVNVTLLGGAFGRKSKPDYVVEAVELSKRLGRPIRVQWSREDDIQYDYYHAASAQLCHAVIGADGLPKAWLQHTAFPTITSTFSSAAGEPAIWELEMGFSNMPYRIANQRFEYSGIKAGVRIGWLRSVCNVFHAFATNVFVDELATLAGRDPIDYRLSMLPESGVLKVPGMQPPPGHELDTGRLRRVLNHVRALSNWDTRQGEALGVAVHHSFRSYVATVISVVVTNGQYRVQDVSVVLDCGTYVNPDTCIAQMEGAVIFGLSLAQQGEITISKGRVNQSNFHDYPVIRMSQSPKITVELIASEALPAGVGEPGVPPVAPALANAIFAATGQRLRKLPLKLA